jgi:hypothetical protein
MPEGSASTNGLHIDLQTLDDLIAAYRAAAVQIGSAAEQIARRAKIPSWTDDPVSQEMAARFNDATFAGTYCSHQGMLAFEAAFRGVVDTLTQMRAEYVRTEGDLAAALRVIDGRPLFDPSYRPGEPQ